MARRAKDGRPSKSREYSGEQLLVAAVFAAWTLKRPWFTRLFEGDVPREAALLVLEVYLRYRRGQLLTMKQAGTAIGADHPETTRKYVKMASDAKVLEVRRAVGDERKRLLVPTKALIDSLDEELRDLADNLRLASEALSAKVPMVQSEFLRDLDEELNPFLAADNPLVQDLFNATDPQAQYHLLVMPGTHLPFGHFLKRAIAEYTETINLAPDSSSGYANRGRAYDLLNQPEDAIKDYTKALELNPELHRGYYLRAGCYTRTHEYRLAVRDWTEVIERDFSVGEVITALHNRASAFRALKQADKAVADYRKVLEVNPVDTIALKGLKDIERGLV